ncbi:hypothetical protein V2J09_018731 [Rumex salicifolius]
MSAVWNNAVQPGGAPNSSQADHQRASGWSSHAPGDGGAGGSRGGWESAGGDSRRLEEAKSWDVLAKNLDGLSVNEGGHSGWDQSPSPAGGGWGSPSGYTNNYGDGAGWGSWGSHIAADVQVDEEPELETDPFGPEVTNNVANNTGINFEAYEDIPVEVTGDGVPPPVNEFGDIDFCDALNANIRRCKYTKPTPIQRHAIPIAAEGRDLMACAQTGSGKTAAFCFPIISGILKKGLQASRGSSSGGRGRRGPREWWQAVCPVALILSPTRELCCQIHDEAKKFAYQTGVKVAVAYGGAPMMNQLRTLQNGVDILVATPGRLIDIIERGRVSLSKVKYLTLDEADRMLDMGFEHQVRKIVQQMEMPAPGVRQTMLFSATFPHEIQKLASEFLSNYVFLSVGKVGSSTDLITQRVQFVDDMEKRNQLTDILTSQNAESVGKDPLTLVFVQTKKGADSLERWLCRKGFPATAIHGDKVQMERERALKLFKSGTTPILVATDVAARGLDIPSVAHVINFDLPSNIDDYVHRIGRTGRAGKSGIATAFFSDKNTPIAKALVEIMEESKQEVPTWLHEHSQRSSSYVSGSGGRQRYYGGSRGYSPPPYEDSHHYPCSYEPSFTADSSQGVPFDYASIVPTGWDC